MLVPIYGFVQGDTIGVLVFAHDDMTIAGVIEKLRASTSVRVDTGATGSGDARAWELRIGDRVVAPNLTVDEAGLTALDRVDLRRRGAP